VTVAQVIDALERCGCTHEGTAAAALLRRRYWPHLAVSVVLMAWPAAEAAMMALLIGRFSTACSVVHAAGKTRPQAPTIPFSGTPFYLDQIVPLHLPQRLQHGGVRHRGRVPHQGVCDYCGNYLVNYAGFSRSRTCATPVFDKVVRQGAEFFEAHSTGS
jgi:hypothetical protein